MRQRDLFEAAAHAAVTRLRKDIAEGVYRPTADARCVDKLLKVADLYALGAAAVKHRDHTRAADLDAALDRVGKVEWPVAQ